MECLFKQEEIDKITSRELEIYFDNDEPLYRNGNAWIKNFARKMKRGIYDNTKAVFAIQKYLVPNIIKSYDGIELRDVDKNTRNHLAKSIVENFEDTIKIDYESNYTKLIKDYERY